MSALLQLARVRTESQAAPLLAMECDGVLYDLAAAEEFLTPGRSSAGSDFFQRVISMRCDGLDSVATRLRAGRRPTEARLWGEQLCPLAPMDTGRSAYLQAVLAPDEALVQRRDSRSLMGDRWPVPYPSSCSRPLAELGLGVMLGEDVHHATEAEALRAVLGVTLVIDWASSTQRWERHCIDVPSQLGAGLICTPALAGLAGATLSYACSEDAGSGNLTVDPEAVVRTLALASSQHRLLAGDVVCVRLSGWLRPVWGESIQLRLCDAAGNLLVQLQGHTLSNPADG